jgi:membrane protein
MWRAALKETVHTFSRKGGRLLGAGIAFYSLLSVAPILLIALRVAALFTGVAPAQAALREDLAFWLGDEGAANAMELVARVRTPESASQIVVLLLLVYASTRLFSGLKRALNQLWDVPPPESHGVKHKVLRQLRKRALAFLLVVLVGLVLVAVVVARGAFAFASNVVGRSLPFTWELLHTTGSILITALLFGLLFRVLPDKRIAWPRALEGGFVTALLFALGTVLVSAYVGHKHVGASYGAAGSLVMLLLWVHYSAQIFFLGAAFTGARVRQFEAQASRQSTH